MRIRLSMTSAAAWATLDSLPDPVHVERYLVRCRGVCAWVYASDGEEARFKGARELRVPMSEVTAERREREIAPRKLETPW